ncbi:MAG: 6-pyruvoyl trahydropterin synthase family protein [Brevinematia bacterium]
MVYRVIVSSDFFGTHKVRLPNGEWEDPHDHIYKVEVCLSSSSVDENGMVVDFVEVKRVLDEVLTRLSGANLNENVVFSGAIPTAENIAKFIFTEFKKKFKNLEYVRLFETENFSVMVSE